MGTHTASGLTGAQYWWRGDDLPNSGNVTTWTDKVGAVVLGQNAGRTAGGVVNTWTNAATGAVRRAMRVDSGTGSGLATPKTLQPADEWTISLVWRPISGGNPWGLYQSGDSNGVRLWTQIHSSTELRVYQYRTGIDNVGNDIGPIGTTVGTATPGSTVILLAKTYVHVLGNNSGGDGPAAHATSVLTNTAPTRLSLGNSFADFTDAVEAAYFEVVIWDHLLTAPERIAWNDYVFDYYGIGARINGAAGFYEWTGTAETALTLAGHWNGNALEAPVTYTVT